MPYRSEYEHTHSDTCMHTPPAHGVLPAGNTRGCRACVSAGHAPRSHPQLGTLVNFLFLQLTSVEVVGQLCADTNALMHSTTVHTTRARSPDGAMMLQLLWCV